MLVLADEPTGSLDDTTGRQVMDLLLDLVRAEGGTLLFVTHSRELAKVADAVLAARGRPPELRSSPGSRRDPPTWHGRFAASCANRAPSSC